MIIHEAASTKVEFVEPQMSISLPRRLSELACKLGWHLHAPLLRLSYHEILVQITHRVHQRMVCMVELSTSLRRQNRKDREYMHVFIHLACCVEVPCIEAIGDE